MITSGHGGDNQRTRCHAHGRHVWPHARTWLIVGASALIMLTARRATATSTSARPAPSHARVARVIPSHERPTACAFAHRMHRLTPTFLLCAWQCWRGASRPFGERAIGRRGRPARGPAAWRKPASCPTCSSSSIGRIAKGPALPWAPPAPALTSSGQLPVWLSPAASEPTMGIRREGGRRARHMLREDRLWREWCLPPASHVLYCRASTALSACSPALLAFAPA